MEAPLILINRAEWLQRRLRLRLHASLVGYDKQSPFVKFVYFTLLRAAPVCTEIRRKKTIELVSEKASYNYVFQALTVQSDI